MVLLKNVNSHNQNNFLKNKKKCVQKFTRFCVIT
nr:MAG TPA: hypothetical protein [Caudoviricetes sp.]